MYKIWKNYKAQIGENFRKTAFFLHEMKNIVTFSELVLLDKCEVVALKATIYVYMSLVVYAVGSGRCSLCHFRMWTFPTKIRSSDVIFCVQEKGEMIATWLVRRAIAHRLNIYISLLAKHKKQFFVAERDRQWKMDIFREPKPQEIICWSWLTSNVHTKAKHPPNVIDNNLSVWMITWYKNDHQLHQIAEKWSFSITKFGHM